MFRDQSDSGEEASASDSDSSEDSCLGDSACTSRPQLLHGRRVPPSRCGVTRQQLRELLAKLRGDPAWWRENNVYTLISDFIIPWTSGQGLGYALLVNQTCPKEANVMISHCFAENVEEFLEAVIRATSRHDVIFICALGLYQAEDGKGPTISEQLGTRPRDSPFQQVLRGISQRGNSFKHHWSMHNFVEEIPMLVILCLATILYLPIIVWRTDFMRFHSLGECSDRMVQWFVFLSGCCAAACAFLPLFTIWIKRGSHSKCAYAGRMVVVPNREADVYSRLWCVYEMFLASKLGVPVVLAPTLANAGKISSRLATCTRREDAERIRAEIETSRFDYKYIDRVVRRTLRASYKHVWQLLGKYIILHTLPLCAVLGMSFQEAPDKEVFLFSVGISVALMVAVYGWLRRKQGVIHMSRWCFAACACFLICEPVLSITGVILGGFDRLLYQSVFCVLFGIWFILLFLVASLSRPFPSCFRAENRRRLMAALAGFLFVLNLLQTVVNYWAWLDWKNMRSVAFTAFVVTWVRCFPAYVFWTDSVRLGIKVVVEPSSRAAIGKVALVTIWAAGLSMVACIISTDIAYKALGCPNC